jgi:hypothetical protein
MSMVRIRVTDVSVNPRACGQLGPQATSIDRDRDRDNPKTGERVIPFAS